MLTINEFLLRFSTRYEEEHNQRLVAVRVHNCTLHHLIAQPHITPFDISQNFCENFHVQTFYNSYQTQVMKIVGLKLKFIHNYTIYSGMIRSVEIVSTRNMLCSSKNGTTIFALIGKVRWDIHSHVFLEQLHNLRPFVAE